MRYKLLNYIVTKLEEFSFRKYEFCGDASLLKVFYHSLKKKNHQWIFIPGRGELLVCFLSKRLPPLTSSGSSARDYKLSYSIYVHQTEIHRKWKVGDGKNEFGKWKTEFATTVTINKLPLYIF